MGSTRGSGRMVYLGAGSHVSSLSIHPLPSAVDHPPANMTSMDYNGNALLGSFCLGLVVFILYLFIEGINRLYFSPIAGFPGPKLAAITFWNEFYYDVVKNGQYTFEIARLHKKYGPIIRINPYELHVESPGFYEKLYAGGGKKRNRWYWSTRAFGDSESIAASNDHDKHRVRRAAINPFFSKAAVRSLQSTLDEKLDTLLGRFAAFRSSGKIMTVSLAFEAFTNDVVMQYTFGRSENRLEMENFDQAFHNASVKGSSMGPLTKQFPWIQPLLKSMPTWLLSKIDPDMMSFVNLEQSIAEQVQSIEAGSNENWKEVSHRTIFHEILNSKLPPLEKSTKRLCDDGIVMVVAGSLTTSWALSVGTFYLLTQPDTLRCLKEELKVAIPEQSQRVSLPVLEKLPYLTACVQECLRLSYGVSTRLQRICPDEVLVFNDGKKNWQIPAGTPTSMTSVLMHHDPTIFHDSHSFLPERWIENPHLDKFLVSFSKGSRQCIGINLAYAELYLALARIFRSYGSKDVCLEGDTGRLELFETSSRDVKIAADRFMPLPALDSKGIRIRVKDA